MAKGIIITGPQGAGKTTLGKLVARELGFAFFDIDDYIWRKDTEIPYTVMYTRAEKISRLMAAIEKTDCFVMAGSMDSFHAHFDPFFELAVHLLADSQLRADRVHKREMEAYGKRILPGGDMYEEHQRFLEDVNRYYTGGGSVSYAQHSAWLHSLACPVIELDGGLALTQNVQTIVDAWNTKKHD